MADWLQATIGMDPDKIKQIWAYPSAPWWKPPKIQIADDGEAATRAHNRVQNDSTVMALGHTRVVDPLVYCRLSHTSEHEEHWEHGCAQSTQGDSLKVTHTQGDSDTRCP